MSQVKDNLGTAALALAAVGLGVAGFAALSSWKKKRGFYDALEAGLNDRGIDLVAAEVGRSDDDCPTWFVTVNSSKAGLQSFQADFDAGTDLYAASTLEVLLDTLIEAIASARRGRRAR